MISGNIYEIAETNYDLFVEKYKLFTNNILNSPLDIINKCKNKTNEFFILKIPNKFMISGIYTLKKVKDINYHCIYINTRDTIGRQNFTLLHELYHAFFESSNKIVCMYEDELSDKSDIEKRADFFASNLLIPRKILLPYCKEMALSRRKDIEFKEVLDLQIKFKASFEAIIYALDSISKKKELEALPFIPQIPKVFYKYRYPKYWNELEEKTKKYNQYVDLNTSKNDFIFPENFKERLITNRENGLISEADLISIFDLFNEKHEV